MYYFVLVSVLSTPGERLVVLTRCDRMCCFNKGVDLGYL